MNDARRKALRKAGELLGQALELIETAKDEEQDYYDNMPESLQGGEKGDKAQEAVSSLEDIHGNVETAQGDLDEVLNN